MSEPDYFRDPGLIPDPYPYFDGLRAGCPVHREPHHGVYMVTGHAEAVAVYSDPAVFSACNAMSGPFSGFPVPLTGDDVSDLIEAHRAELPMSKELTTMDPPRHTELRSIVGRFFTPRNVAHVEVSITALADRLIDAFVERGACEFTTEFAEPFTLLNICELLGVPETDRKHFLDDMTSTHRDRRIGNTSAGTPTDPFAFLHSRFRPYIEQRRTAPCEDMMSTLATATLADGTPIEVIDAVRLASVLFVAGVGTTALLLGTMLRVLADRPDLQQRLRDEPSLVPNFVEEMLRYDGPVKGGFRLSRVPTTIGGVALPAGSTVMMVNAAANRDPRKFDAPDEIRADRENARQHLGFGHGIHVCVGAPLARAEARIGLERVLARLDDIRLDPTVHGAEGARELQFVPSFITRGVQRVQLQFAATTS